MKHVKHVLVLALAALSLCARYAEAQTAPTELEGVYAESNQTIELRWRAPENPSPTAYGVYRKPAADSSFQLLATVTDDRHDDHALTFGTAYEYYVTAFFGVQESGPSNIVNVFAAKSIDSLQDSSQTALQITSAPLTHAQLGQTYHYDVTAVTSPAGQNVCFELHDAPIGMTIDASTGAIDWLPTGTGLFEVEVRARICSTGDGETGQRFILTVFSGAAGRVDGFVLNDSGTGVSAIRVRLFDLSTGDFVFRTTTDDSGRFSFPAVNPATYFVRVNDEHGIYASQWFDGATRLADATPVAVGESSTVTLELKLQAKAPETQDRVSISGHVRSAATGAPLAAKVTAFSAADSSQDDDESEFDDHGRDGGDDDGGGGDRTGSHGDDHLKATVTFADSLGHFTLSLKPGTYILAARADGFVQQFWDHKTSALDADLLQANLVDVHRDTSEFDFALEPQPTGTGSISGTIRLAAGGLPLESHVTLFGQDSLGHLTGLVFATESDSFGQYTLGALPSGSYLVLAHGHGHDIEPTFYSLSGGTPFLDNATAVSVGAIAVTGIDIYVRSDSADGLDAVEGEVESDPASGGQAGRAVRFTQALTPLPGTLVAVKDATSGAVVASAISLPDGSYHIAGVAPGSYFMIFQKPGHGTVNIPVSLSYVGTAPVTTTINAQLIPTGSAGTTSTVNLLASWNMVSVPLAVADASVASLFPGAASQAFFFGGTGYQTSATLQNGSGYWLKFSSAQTLPMQGTARPNESIHVEAGWNLIGTPSLPVDVATVQASSPGLIASLFFGYDGGYKTTTALEPGQGYWVKASASGTLTMAGAVSAPKSAGLPAVLEHMNAITFSNGNQSQTLYVGTEASGLNAATFELPPAAPGSDVFDARYANGRLAALHPAVVKAPLAYPIELRTSARTVTITWSIHSGDARYTLAYPGGSINLTQGEGSATIAVPASATTLVLGAAGESIPKAFALNQNYPNPFNPSTTIDYALPEDARVTLKIFNLLGQEVRTVLDDVETAGFKSVRIEASSIPSGVYFYRLQAGQRAETKRMLLLK